MQWIYFIGFYVSALSMCVCWISLGFLKRMLYFVYALCISGHFQILVYFSISLSSFASIHIFFSIWLMAILHRYWPLNRNEVVVTLFSISSPLYVNYYCHIFFSLSFSQYDSITFFDLNYNCSFPNLIVDLRPKNYDKSIARIVSHVSRFFFSLPWLLHTFPSYISHLIIVYLDWLILDIQMIYLSTLIYLSIVMQVGSITENRILQSCSKTILDLSYTIIEIVWADSCGSGRIDINLSGCQAIC